MTNRLFVMTIGKTHSGKTTFANALKQKLSNSVVIDQEAHVEFLQSYYQDSLPKQGNHTMKNTMSKLALDYYITCTNTNMIVCNTHLSRAHRLTILEKIFTKNKFTRILIYFEIPEDVIVARIKESNRSISQFRSDCSNFEEVLALQKEASSNLNEEYPQLDEADYIFIINDNCNQDAVIEEILHISAQLSSTVLHT